MESDLIRIVKNLAHLKRYHNSKDMHRAVEELVNTFGGTEDIYIKNLDSTWAIPDYYTVHHAKLFRNMQLIADYNSHPLCLWSYSSSFKGTLSYEEISDKILTDPNRPNARIFHFRNQYQKKSDSWGFSIPYEQFSQFNADDKFYVDIETSFEKLPMKQYFLGHPGKKNFILVAHLDHPNQVNDGLSSCIINNFVASRLRTKLKTINLISLNSVEIIGTVLFLRKFQLNNLNTIGAISTNGLMGGNKISFQYSSKNGDCKLDQLAKLYQKIYSNSISNHIFNFREGWGNDEIAFEVPGVSIPCVSMYRFNEECYHTDLDDLSTVNPQSITASCEILSDFIEAIDSDRKIHIHFDHLLCLSSPDINLYLEPSEISGLNKKIDESIDDLLINLSEQEKSYIEDNYALLNKFMNFFMPYLSDRKDASVLDVAITCSLPPKFVLNYFQRLQSIGFIELLEC